MWCSYGVFAVQATLSPAGVKEALTAYKSVQKFMSHSDAGIQLSIVNSLGNIKVCTCSDTCIKRCQ